jgi:hypothetical protein
MSQVDPNNNSIKFILREEEEKPNLWNLWNLFGSRKVHRLSLENCTSISIRAERINNLVRGDQISPLTRFQSSSTPWWLFFDFVPVQLGDDNFNVNISSCAKKLGISKKEVVELAKQGGLEKKITEITELQKKGIEIDLLTKIDNFLNTNQNYTKLVEADKQKLKSFIERNVSVILSNQDNKLLIDDGSNSNFKIRIENKKILLGFPLINTSKKDSIIAIVYHHIQ